MHRVRRFLGLLRHHAADVVVAVAGVVVIVAGVVLMPLPGPGTLIAIAGLAILATRFQWARRLLDRLRDRAGDLVDRIGWARRLRARMRGLQPGRSADSRTRGGPGAGGDRRDPTDEPTRGNRS